VANPRNIGPITIEVPIDAVLAVRSSARMSRDGISDDYEGYRHKGRDYEDMARRRAAEMADLDVVLGQLGDDDEQEREVTAGYDTLHGILGDVLMEAVQRLAVEVGRYWRVEGSLGDVDRQIAVIQERVALLREAERAADERRASERDDGDDDQSSP
jgi:SHS2 domain-containing protein